MLRLDAVEFSRGDFTLKADFALPKGKRTAVIGPSGGGKSTLLSLIAGFETLDRGSISWKGQRLEKRAPGKRPIATLFQDSNLFPHLDLTTNVALGIAPNAKPAKDVLDQANAALEKVGLVGMGTRLPGDLSGGQQSRAALARILVTKRPVVLLDEPFAALGPSMRSDMLNLAATLLPDATILMVTHDPEDAKRFSDLAVFVDQGVVDAPQDTAALFENPTPALRTYLG